MLKLLSKKKLAYTFLVILLVFLGSFLTWRFTLKHANKGQQERSTVMLLVGKLILLPKDEDPTFAVVTDKNEVKDPFLADKVQNNDDILVYAKNRLVIVYRPSINKIVTVGAVSADPALTESAGTTISVLDGSNDPKKAAVILSKIQRAYPDSTVTDGGRTNRQDFPGTIVIDNTNAKDNLVDALTSLIAGKRGVMPISEAKMGTDIEIIVGND